ncbi:MAG: hypothetical protein AB1305_03990 [Candidatus Hadarchaeota archaeon]
MYTDTTQFEAGAPLEEIPKWVRKGAVILAGFLMFDAFMLAVAINYIGLFGLAIGFTLRFAAAVGLVWMKRWGVMIAGFLTCFSLAASAILLNLARNLQRLDVAIVEVFSIFLLFTIFFYLIISWKYFR